MAKKRKTIKKKSAPKPTYSLPVGFWAQVGAVVMLAVALLLVVNWFNAGGPLLEGIHDLLMTVIGYGVLLVPLVLVYLAISIFQAEDNKLPTVVYVAAAILVLLASGLFGLTIHNASLSTGGYVGDGLTLGLLKLVNSNVAVFVYILLIFITLIFMFRVTPNAIIEAIKNLFKTDINDQPEATKAQAKLPIINGGSEQKATAGDFQLVEGVPTFDSKTGRGDKGLKFDPLPKPKENKLALVSVRDPNWKMPPVEILESKQSPADVGDIKTNVDIIKRTLQEFDIEVEMTGANVGPKVTQYTLAPQSGVKLARIAALETNLALNLAAQSLRIEAPIPGQRAVGIEVPNIKAADVRLRGILQSDEWSKNQSKLDFVVGKDIAGRPVVEDLNDMPHLLIAGQTGSGKSVMINTLLVSLLYRNSPSDMRLILVDPKQVEMAAYKDIPHLLTPIITEPDKTISALKWAVNEMERRYKLLAEVGKKDIDGYNQHVLKTDQTVAIEDEEGNVQQHNDGAMPFIVIVIDEMADLMMMAKRDVETLVVKIAQKARAVGIHLVLATQRPSVNVVTGLIKANVPSRIAFTVASQVDSKTILDKSGAEKLLGKGDMLMMTTRMNKPRRIQGAFVADEEVHKVTDFLRQQRAVEYNDEVVAQEVVIGGNGVVSSGSGDRDELFKQAAQIVISENKASTTFLQLRLKIGYARAARIMGELEEDGIVGPQDGSRPREVLISSLEDFE